MKDSLVLSFLYKTVPGRMLLKLLVRPGVSEAVGVFMDSKLSKILIRPFVAMGNISLSGVEKPLKDFNSFNDFFKRKRSGNSFDMTAGHLCCPCDGKLSYYDIDNDSKVYIKHNYYSIEGLLRSSKLARRYAGGLALVFRLTPDDYHRYSYVDNGQVAASRKIDGVLHCVRPIACERFPVFIQNSRQYSVIKSDNFGTFIQMEVGALLVGRICNYDNSYSVRGEEKGYFEYGGSTIIMLFEPDKVELLPHIKNLLDEYDELQIRVGEYIGYRKSKEGDI